MHLNFITSSGVEQKHFEKKTEVQERRKVPQDEDGREETKK